jgi:hypothetical protein
MPCDAGSNGSMIPHSASFTSVGYAFRVIVETSTALLLYQFLNEAIALFCSLYISLETASYTFCSV